MKELVCIVCPIGCKLTVNDENGNITVTGNGCKRGAEYGKNELVDPRRTLTTTVRCKNGELLSVKTETAISKKDIKKAMEIINKCSPDLPISVGDVIIEDVMGSRVVATQNL